MNTNHTEAQVTQALDILETVWGDNQQYKDLSESAKDLLAHTLLTAHELTRK